VYDYDEKNGLLDIHRSIVDTSESNGRSGCIVQDSLKIRSSYRTIPLNKTAIEALTHLKELKYDEDGYILSTRNQTFVTPVDWRVGMVVITKKAGLPSYSPHALRHTFATEMFDKGMDVKLISAILGHSNVKTTYDIYIDVISKMENSLIKMDDYDI
jgi:integrase